MNNALAEPWENLKGASAKVKLVSGPDATPLAESMTFLTADHPALAPYFWVVIREWDQASNSRLHRCYTCNDRDTLCSIQLAFEIWDHWVTIDSWQNPDEVGDMCLRYGKVVHFAHHSCMHVGWTPWDGQKADWRFIDEVRDGASGGPIEVRRALDSTCRLQPSLAAESGPGETPYCTNVANQDRTSRRLGA